MRITATLLLLALPVGALAQFEVVSIRPDDNNTAGSMSVRIEPGGRFVATAASIRMLIRNAFDLQSFQLEGGPAWLDSVRYDINAKTANSAALTREDLKPLLQSVLVERFGLAYHREMREMPVYRLVTNKGTSKLIASLAGPDVPPSITGSNRDGNARIVTKQVSMADLARELSGQLQIVVLNETALSSIYDFTLEWSFNPGAESLYPSIFTAIQNQLGLKLEAGKGLVPIIVVDHVERLPTEN
jgi:uncharacterized protein (TIGR03435 family)